MDFSSAFALVIATFIFVMTPGPGIIATISMSLSRGLVYAMVLSLGLILGDIVYLLIAIYGLSLLIDVLGDFFIIVRVVGGIYFLYLGYTMISAKINRFKLDNKVVHSKKKAYLQGLLISLSNPKVILFYLGFLPVFIDLEALNNQDVLIITAIIFITLLMGCFLYAFLVAWAKKMIEDEKKLKLLNMVSGFLMVFVGLFLLFGY